MSDNPVVVKSKCPFCGQKVIALSQTGKCPCGVAYAVLPTPKQSVMIQAKMQEGNGFCPVSVRYDGIVKFYRLEKVVCVLSQAEIQAISSDADFPVFLESDFRRT